MNKAADLHYKSITLIELTIPLGVIKYQFLVPGSGRLDIYQKGGDSLAGRYFMFHLWPFTLAEIDNAKISHDAFRKNPLQISMERSEELQQIWSNLSEFSGFPEPYLSGRKTSCRRWSNTYSQQLIHLLPSRIGGPISVPALSPDLKVSYNTIRSWLLTFERFFLVFNLTPWTRRIARAIQKEQSRCP